MTAVRFGLIGYGAWGSHHARAIAAVEDAELVAISARSESSRQVAAAAHPKARLHSDYHRLLSEEPLDIVSVVLPSDLHYEVGRAVLESGRHLLLEKPMALSVDHCSELIELAAARGRWIAVGHEFRFSPLWGKVKELINAGAVGRPQYMLIELWRRPYRLGSNGWRYDIRRVGNWTLEEPIHFFDLARWCFSAAGNPTSVYARAIGRQADHPELTDNFSALMTFADGGYAIVSQTLAGWEHHQVVKVTGTAGALWATWSGALDRTFKPSFRLQLLTEEKSLVEVPLEGTPGEVYELVEEMRMLTRAIKEGGRPGCTGEDGRWSVAMCLKAEESISLGRPVALSET